MDRMLARQVLACALAALPLAAPARASTTETHEFRYDVGRIRLVPESGTTRIQVDGGVPERRAGHPDLPTIAERLEIPAGMRVDRVEVVTLETAPLGEPVMVAPAREVRRDDGPEPATAPDPALYASAAFQPDLPVRLGYQGYQRENHYAWLEVTPVRWAAASGRLERVSRLVVRLTLEPSATRPIPRERVVAEWEPRHAGVVSSPPALHARRGAQPFRPTQLPSVLGSPVEYVIVTDDSLAAAFQPLADWKTQSGVPAVVRTTSFIRANYPSAADDAERIRSFIRDAYTRWGTQWVLLGGDVGIVPHRITHMTYVDGEQVTSDLYYSCLDGNWNANGDSAYADAYAGPSNPGDDADLLPEVWVGRAPAQNAVEALRFVQKTLTYEKTPVSDYMNAVLFFAQVISPEPWSPGHSIQLDGAQLVEQDMLPILDTAPWIHVARLYQNDTAPAYRPGALHETRAVVYDSLEHGYNIAVHVGHGYREVMSCGDDNLTNNDMMALANGNRLMNFYAIDCTSNAIDFASIGEALLRAPSGGAVTNIGSTTLDFPSVGRVYQKQYFHLLFVDSVTAVGEAQGRQKLPFVGDSYYDGFDRLSQLSLLLLGDPELRIYTATPRDLAVTAPATFAASDSSVTVHVETSGAPLFGARGTISMPGHEYESGLTDGGGDVILPFHPDSLGPATVTVTAFNARPWQQTLAVVPGAAPALEAGNPSVLDDNLDGRHGNGNGLADAAELIDLRLALRNAGGTTASNVVGTLSTSDAWVGIVTPTASYGGIDPGASVTPAGDYRLSVPFGCPDQHEAAFTLDLLADGGLHQQQRFQLLIHAPELLQVTHDEVEESGNGDGQPGPGETIRYTFRIRNIGTGDAHALSGAIASDDGLATVLDSLFTLGDLAAGTEIGTTPVRFVPASGAARLTLRVNDADGIRLLQTLDLGYPVAVTGLSAAGGGGLARLNWIPGTAPDLRGYDVYRGTSVSGPFQKVSAWTPGRTSSLVDGGLAPLTLYYYRVTAVDSSGNESAPSSIVAATSNPPMHAGFPAWTNETSDTPVAVDHVDTGYPRDIVVGGQVLHLFHPDGTAPVDADGIPSTPGDLSTVGTFYPGGGSISDLDGNGSREIIGAAWTTHLLLVCDAQGHTRPGFPVSVSDPMWSSVAVADLDGDGHKEMVFACLAHGLYAFRDDGTEWRDGDSNPATIGVFKTLASGYNPGTPALADLEGTGVKDIIYGGGDGFLYAWRPDGTNVPGFPVNLGVSVAASAVVGRLDGPAGPYSIVVPAGDNSIRVRLADGSNRPGFPVFLPTTGTDRTSSPALADMNGDGLPEVVYASTNGRIYVFDRNGTLIAPWTNARFSALTSAAVQASPVVADINGDGFNDVVVGDESGELAALSGADGSMLPGFPIALGAEGTGTAALCDCDGDGKTEIVDVDYGGTVRMWDYDHPFSPHGSPPWPQFQHDAERTGCADTPPTLAVGPPAITLPLTLELAAPRPNPARATLRIAFGIPAARDGAPLDLAVFDITGRRVRTLAHGPSRPGRVELTWDLRADDGSPAASGVYLVHLRSGNTVLTRKVVALR
ncbi:MAG: C25 family cysteine peptidase [Candidatus Eisenbacteria bacterium]